MKGGPPRPLWCDSCWKAGQHRAWQAGKRPFYENLPFEGMDVGAYAVRVTKWIKSKQ